MRTFRLRTGTLLTTMVLRMNRKNNMTTEFKEFPKIARYSRECIVTEKIDGTNASIFIGEGEEFLIGSRTRWITTDQDNYGFAKWATEHKKLLLKLGKGLHFGEWWGSGIQRGYNLPKGEKRFSLFNTTRWCYANPKQIPTADPRIIKYQEVLPEGLHLVPEMYRGSFDDVPITNLLCQLKTNGSLASNGFMNPEGIVIYHVAAGIGFKKTLDKDSQPKSLIK
jgi:hypothetical protein